MSEMLGNRYLLALRAMDAIPHFESRLLRHPEDWRSAQKLAICHALLGHPKTALDWLARALDGAPGDSRVPGSDESLLEQLASEIREHRDDLGNQRASLGLACAHLFREPAAARSDLDHALEEIPENDPLHALIETIESRLEVER